MLMKRKTYKDFYDLFGLPTNADESEIKERTDSFIKKFHPDIADENISVTEKQFKVLNEARDTLLDEDKRKEYDDLGHKLYVDENYKNEFEGFNFKGRNTIKEGKMADEDDVDELIKTNYNHMEDVTKEMNKFNKDDEVEEEIDTRKVNSKNEGSSILLIVLRIFNNKFIKYSFNIFFLLGFYTLLYVIFNLLTVVFAVLLTVGLLYVPIVRNIFF